MAEGNPNVVLCERGIRTFETATRNTLDISAVPVIREKSHLHAERLFSTRSRTPSRSAAERPGDTVSR
mgnify:CR=1 FL=1